MRTPSFGHASVMMTPTGSALGTLSSSRRDTMPRPIPPAIATRQRRPALQLRPTVIRRFLTAAILCAVACAEDLTLPPAPEAEVTPTITDFHPKVGFWGEVVAIEGTGFD